MSAVSRAVLAALALLAAPTPTQAAETRQVTAFGPNPGQLLMFERLPDRLPAHAPLVVALHGCTQTATGFDDESGWAELAERFGFALLLPEQQAANNDARCFNFFREEDNRRDQGEAASIRSMIATMLAAHRLDPARVFVTGLSAGGAMTSVMLAAYPELFAGGAVVAGVPYGCASTGNDPVLTYYRLGYLLNPVLGEAAWAASRCGISRGVPPFPPAPRDPNEWRELVDEAGGGGRPARGWPKVSLWQGGGDRTVHPANLQELVEQWTALHAIDRAPDAAETVAAYRRQAFADAAGEVRVEAFLLPGLGHAVPVDPGPGPAQCGIVSRHDPHFVDRDVCAALRIASFWGLAGPL
jgi:poly(3-hydroxybutyrate) depolymerase